MVETHICACIRVTTIRTYVELIQQMHLNCDEKQYMYTLTITFILYPLRL